MTSKKHRWDIRLTGIPTDSWVLRLTVAFVVWLVVTAANPICASDGKGPRAGVKPLDENGRMQVSAEDRCPVCGMKVNRYPKFAAAVQLRSGATFYFCSTGCMIRSWMHPEIYLAASATELKQPVVKEYFSGRQVDGRRIIFVFGSDVIGPMGPALVPVMDENYLKVFKKRHGGKSQFFLDEMDDDQWLEMTGRKIER
jgi:nitrous oxide reductase accessory protein NosL